MESKQIIIESNRAIEWIELILILNMYLKLDKIWKFFLHTRCIDFPMNFVNNSIIKRCYRLRDQFWYIFGFTRHIAFPKKHMFRSTVSVHLCSKWSPFPHGHSVQMSKRYSHRRHRIRQSILKISVHVFLSLSALPSPAPDEWRKKINEFLSMSQRRYN